jgi:transcriptional regulator with GAF, ATPase, and Fis domain
LTGDEITAADVRLITEEELAAAPQPEATSAPAAPAQETGTTRDRLVALLSQHGGNLSAVARGLSTSRTQVARLLARHGLSPDDFRRR